MPCTRAGSRDDSTEIHTAAASAPLPRRQRPKEIPMKVSDAMTRDVMLVRPDQSIREAAALMEDCDIGSLPVADSDRLVGMITDRDIAVRAVAKGLSPDTQVSQVMSKEVLYCFEDD